jgi:hypothetical protein
MKTDVPILFVELDSETILFNILPHMHLSISSSQKIYFIFEVLQKHSDLLSMLVLSYYVLFLIGTTN